MKRGGYSSPSPKKTLTPQRSHLPLSSSRGGSSASLSSSPAPRVKTPIPTPTKANVVSSLTPKKVSTISSSPSKTPQRGKVGTQSTKKQQKQKKNKEGRSEKDVENVPPQCDNLIKTNTPIADHDYKENFESKQICFEDNQCQTRSLINNDSDCHDVDSNHPLTPPHTSLLAKKFSNDDALTESPRSFAAKLQQKQKAQDGIILLLTSQVNRKKQLLIGAQEQASQLASALKEKDCEINKLQKEVEEFKRQKRGSDGEAALLRFKLSHQRNVNNKKEAERVPPPLPLSQEEGCSTRTNDKVQHGSPDRQSWLMHWRRTQAILRCVRGESESDDIHVMEKNRIQQQLVEQVRVAQRLEAQLRTWVDSQINIHKSLANAEALAIISDGDKFQPYSTSSNPPMPPLPPLDVTMTSTLVPSPSSTRYSPVKQNDSSISHQRINADAVTNSSPSTLASPNLPTNILNESVNSSHDSNATWCQTSNSERSNSNIDSHHKPVSELSQRYLKSSPRLIHALFSGLSSTSPTSSTTSAIVSPSNTVLSTAFLCPPTSNQKDDCAESSQENDSNDMVDEVGDHCWDSSTEFSVEDTSVRNVGFMVSKLDDIIDVHQHQCKEEKAMEGVNVNPVKDSPPVNRAHDSHLSTDSVTIAALLSLKQSSSQVSEPTPISPHVPSFTSSKTSFVVSTHDVATSTTPLPVPSAAIEIRSAWKAWLSLQAPSPPTTSTPTIRPSLTTSIIDSNNTEIYSKYTLPSSSPPISSSTSSSSSSSSSSAYIPKSSVSSLSTLSPASFRDQMLRVRKENSIIRDDIQRFRSNLRKLRAESSVLDDDNSQRI